MKHIITNIKLICEQCKTLEDLSIARIYCNDNVENSTLDKLLELIKFFQLKDYTISIDDEDNDPLNLTNIYSDKTLLHNSVIKINKNSNNTLIFSEHFAGLLEYNLPSEIYIYDNFNYFSSFTTKFIPIDNTAIENSTPIWNGENDLKKYVNNYSRKQIEYTISSIILAHEPTKTSSIFEAWATDAVNKQLIALSTQYESQEDQNFVVYKGDSYLKIEIPFHFTTINDFLILNQATKWVYSASKESETKHHFFTNFAANIVLDKDFFSQLQTVLERAQNAFKYDILKQNKEVIELVNTANRLVVEEVTSINQKIHEGIENVLRNLLIFVAVLVLQVVKDFNTSLLPFIYNSVSGVILVLFLIELFNLISFNLLIANLLDEKRDGIYFFMTKDEFDKKIKHRIKWAITKSYIVYSTIFLLYVAIYLIFLRIISTAQFDKIIHFFS